MSRENLSLRFQTEVLFEPVYSDDLTDIGLQICIHSTFIERSVVHKIKQVRALRGKNGPLFSKKMKVAFHENHPIGLSE